MTQIDADEKRDPQTFAIIDACMEVHTVLGSGFSETVYQQAAAIEFTLRDIPHVKETPTRVL